MNKQEFLQFMADRQSLEDKENEVDELLRKLFYGHELKLISQKQQKI